jgi:PKD repeat protein
VAGLTVSFADHSTGASEWSWDFGDGATSTERNPHHAYASGGTFTVTLDVFAADGSTVSTSVDVIVAP